MKSILIVDDEKNIREVVSSYLQREGYHIYETVSGKEAIKLVQSKNIDLVILDPMLPDISGEETCQTIRRVSSVPIIMLTAKITEQQQIDGLSIGADDYVLKPFSPKELVARVKAVLRRNDHELLADRISFNEGDLTIVSTKREVLKHNEVVNLTPNEYKLLMVLVTNPNRPFTRDELVEKIFGYDSLSDPRTIDSHIKNVRKKIETNPKEPTYIQTVFGVGYKFHGGI
jgi:two-component system, OmpR family, response regulator ResD